MSFILPGLGQVYRGKIFQGFAWGPAVLLGYLAYVLPGLLLHLLCVINARSGDATS